MHDNVIRLAVFGKTGAGKTSFVVSATGELFEIGHGGASCTVNVQAGHVRVGGKNVILIDTPGFDDTESRDPEIFETIAAWLAKSRAQGKELNGVIFMQPITDPRVPNSERNRTRLFKKIIGDQFYGRVAIVTTMWDQVRESFGEQNERTRTSENFVWGDMLVRGAQIFRFQNTQQSALEVVRHFTENPSMSAPAPTLLQDELQAHEGRLRDTSAAKQFEIDLGKKVNDLQLSIQSLGGNRPMEARVQAIQTWRSRLKNIVMKINWKGFLEVIGLSNDILELANSCATM
ncbi:P-loop containing nucleoside triphosphate hydrolase protein [Hypoxylon crocopeplum]|nr:P-loop containing nucleoside triphosphate hydrolase protein [Hypoxylon crocopeplum]